MFDDTKSIKQLAYLQRNYDLEWEFIKNMDILAEYNLHDTVIVNGENPNIVGLYMIFGSEGVNDNKIGEI